MRSLVLLFALMLALAVGGCASTLTSRSSSGTANAERSLSGRISVHYKDLGSDREESLHGRLEWTQTGTQIELALLDPLGQTMALVTTTGSSTTLRLRDGKTYQGRTPEDLSEQVLGWRLPVRGLSAWLDGKALPDVTATEEKAGEARVLKQDGWTITYPGSTTTRINLDYPGPPVLVEIKLVIDERANSDDSNGADERKSATPPP